MLGKVLLYSFFAGVVGTAVGGIIGCLVKKQNKHIMAGLFAFAGGVMLGVVTFDLLLEAIVATNLFVVGLSVVVGVVFVFIAENFTNTNLNKKMKDAEGDSQKMLLTGIVIFFSILIHNLPEGLVIGSGTIIGHGVVSSILIGLHNIPEGIAIALPLKAAGMKSYKVIGVTTLSGVAIVVGALLGYFLGNVSPIIIGVSLGLASGAMMTVVFSEMLPKSNSLSENNVVSSLFTVIGVFVGLILTQVI